MNGTCEQRVLVKVWDWPTRVLHWVNAKLILALIFLFFFSYAAEDLLGVDDVLIEPVNKLHAVMGHILIITFALRILWGFLGNRYARWADLLPKKEGLLKDIRWYLSGFRGLSANARGHDPLASIFYIILFAALFVMAGSGLVLSGAEFEFSSGAWLYNLLGGTEAVEEMAEGAHEAGFLYIAFFIIAHMVGLVAHELKERSCLLSSMIHGSKSLPRE
jgi:Ni,Fe-hydrogenase I cytochrome b subunit